MRLYLPLLIPVACGLGLAVFPEHATGWTFALVASLLTYAAAAPGLFRRTRDTTRPAPASRAGSSPQSSVLWRVAVAVNVVGMIWAVGSLAALVINPENAQSWTLHLGGSMLFLMLWTPLVVFAYPSPPTKTASSQAATGSESDPGRDEATPADFIPEHTLRLHPTTQASEGEGDDVWPSSEPAAPAAPASRPVSEQNPAAEEVPGAPTRSLWSYTEDDATGAGEHKQQEVDTPWGRVPLDAPDDLSQAVSDPQPPAPSDESSWEPDEWPDFDYRI